jgi:hypothetical protein
MTSLAFALAAAPVRVVGKGGVRHGANDLPVLFNQLRHPFRQLLKTRQRDQRGETDRGSILADKLLGPSALFASETDEVRFGLSDFVPGQSHDRATAKASWIFAGVQRIQQVFLLARHSSASVGERQKHRRPRGHYTAWPSSALSRSSQNSVAG